MLQERRIEHLELDLKLAGFEVEHYKQIAQDLQPTWWEKILGDPRVWFLLGAAAWGALED